ncbi:hypothetical protein [Brevundimonas pishanensis]|uniref:hypothetical protein n=1 Tax=Brevundimonas pishanensis TaxID=2896315 RepID=UPI001FA7232F|nr:hypothetical protein [Brevundimonas pishanensis]
MADSRLDRLERLNRLRESGALTQQEFEREKLLLDMPSQEPVAAPRSGDSSKALLLVSIAALAVVAAGAVFLLTQNREPSVVREAAPTVVQPSVQAPTTTNAPEAQAQPVEPIAPAQRPADPLVAPQPAVAEPNLTGGFYDYRTRIREGWRGRPNLAGEYVVIRWGCGSGCTTGVVGNKRTGELHWLELGGEDYPYLQLQFGAGGNNVLATWREDLHLCAAQMFQWNGRRMIAQEQAEFRKTPDDDCSI